MIRWEYAQLAWWKELDPHGAYLISIRAFFPDGEIETYVNAQAGPSQGPFHYINELGNDGWELVHVETTMGLFSGSGIRKVAGPIERRFWLKRPIAEPIA